MTDLPGFPDFIDLSSVNTLTREDKIKIIEFTLPDLLNEGLSQRGAIAYFRDVFHAVGFQSIQDSDLARLYNTAIINQRDPNIITPIETLPISEGIAFEQMTPAKFHLRENFFYAGEILAVNTTTGAIEITGIGAYTNERLGVADARQTLLNVYGNETNLSTSPFSAISIRLRFAERNPAIA